MNRAARIALYALAGLAGLVLVLTIAALIVVQTPWFRERVRERTVYEIENATGGRAELRSFDFDWRALRAAVNGLVIHGTEEPGQPPLFRADSVQVGLKIVSVLKKDVDIESLVVRRPAVNLIVHPDGGTNLPKPRAARKREKSPVEQILDLAIGRFHLDDGTIDLQERRMPLNVRGEDLRARFFYEMAEPRYRGDISLRKLYLTPAQGATLPVDFQGKFALARNRLDIEGARIAFKESTLDVSGALENFAAPRAEITYSAHVRFHDVAPVVGLAAVPSQGDMTLGGRIVVSAETGYALSGRLHAAGLSFQQRGLRVQDVGISSEVALTPEKIELRDLVVTALGGSLAGRAEIVKFRDFRLDGAIRDFLLSRLPGVQGRQPPAWNGVLSGPLQLSGELARRGPQNIKAQARLAITPAPGPNPVSGLLDLAYDQRTGTLGFGNCFLATGASRVGFSGALGRRMEVAFQSSDLSDLKPALALFSSGPPKPLPVRLENGLAGFRGLVTGPVRSPLLDGHVSLTSFVVEDRRVDSLETDVAASHDQVRVRNLKLRKQRLLLAGNGQIGLQDWKPGASSAISGAFSLRTPNVADALAEAGQKPPMAGELAADVELSGALGRPQLAAHINLLKGVAYDQPFDHIEANGRYSEGLLEVSSAQLEAGQSRLRLAGAFAHPKENWREGRLRFELSTPRLLLAQLRPVQERVPGIEGRVQGTMAGEVQIAGSALRIGSLDGQLAFRSLAVDRTPMGDLVLTATTAKPVLNLDLRGNLVGSKVRGESQWRLEGNYPARGAVEFSRLQFSTLLARLRPRSGQQESPFLGFIEGKVEFSGSTLQSESWRGAVQLAALEIRPNPQAAPVLNSQELALSNRGPVVVSITPKAARIESAQLVGKDTDLSVAGTVAFGAKNPWDLRVRGTVNLAVLRDFDPQLNSAGRLALDASLRGPLERPDVYGRIELQNASFNYGDLPNGIDKASGVIFLFRDRATIEKLTGETGGGKLSVGGFIVFGAVTTFSLEAKAEEVRVRYPAGVSTTVSASLSFTGTVERSVLGGEVTVTRIAFNPQTDLGSLLARTAQPIPAPERPSRLVQGVRLDIRIETSPQVRFETTLARSIQAEADLRLRGDPLRPILLGRVLINQGEVVFFGNRYTIDSGEIIFVNPARIEPILNLHLDTRVRGIEVTLNVNGPLSKPNVTYRSDPPLPFSDIVALLATGRTPTATPGLVGSRSELSQSWEQAGASALVTQAIADPLAGRLQRFFGVSRLKIDPRVTGAENTPEAHLTLEQQISQNLTFSYITNLTRAQQQTIRVEWDFTRDWSAVAVREANGLFGVDFLYKKRFK